MFNVNVVLLVIFKYISIKYVYKYFGTYTRQMSVHKKFDGSRCHRSQDLAVYARKKRTNKPKNIKSGRNLPFFLCNT